MENISVIMPLFNAEKYLPEALQSVLDQTYKDFELICINDCSTDGTARVLTDFQRMDKRIKILVNRTHLGAGPSRNRGLKVSSGRYVIFLDGDDIFEEILLEKAYITMEKYQTDVVLFEYSSHTPSELIHIKKVMSRSKGFVENYCKVPFSAKDFEPQEFPDWFDSPWNKMFRKRFIEENELQFQNLPSSNDVYFVKMALFCAKKIIWMDDRRVMVYAREHSEPSRISNDRNPMCAYYAMEKLAAELAKRNMFGTLADVYYYVLASTMLYLLTKEKNEECKKKFFSYLKNVGILKCIQFGGENYNKVDSYYRYILENILGGTYESEVFDNCDTYFQHYLKKNGEAVLKFLKEKLGKGKKIALWGVGINGKSLLDYLDEHSIMISAVTDMDINKQGTMVNKYVITYPDKVLHVADVIITTSPKTAQEIKSIDKKTGSEIVNVLALLKQM